MDLVSEGVVIIMEPVVPMQKKGILISLNEKPETTIGHHQEEQHPLVEVVEEAVLVTENNYGTH